MRSIVDRVRSRFDVRLSEVDGLDTWQRAVLGCAVVGNNATVLESLTAQVVDYVDSLGLGRLVADDRETIHYDDLAHRTLAEEST